jgi:RNase P subunit RPR2
MRTDPTWKYGYCANCRLNVFRHRWRKLKDGTIETQVQCDGCGQIQQQGQKP